MTYIEEEYDGTIEDYINAEFDGDIDYHSIDINLINIVKDIDVFEHSNRFEWFAFDNMQGLLFDYIDISYTTLHYLQLNNISGMEWKLDGEVDDEGEYSSLYDDQDDEEEDRKKVALIRHKMEIEEQLLNSAV
jgi:hypothetical protein